MEVEVSCPLERAIVTDPDVPGELLAAPPEREAGDLEGGRRQAEHGIPALPLFHPRHGG